ncbi:MAG TPA: FAD-dependent oxidoreductase [Verrucomicrobiae bacterium]|nr:FAD-dependent oxidoreductase [Verrucomicrobiae bacterium]
MPSARQRLVVVGAGAGGDAAVVAARAAGFDGPVLLVGDDPHPAYERPFLSKGFLRDEVPLDRVFLHPPDGYSVLDVEWIGGRRVVDADPRARSLTLDDGRRFAFDQLVLATGGAPRWLEGAPRAANVLTLRTLDDSIHLRQALTESHRLLVIGAGFVGAEVAASARMQAKEVLLIEAAAVPLERALGEKVGGAMAELHRRHGVDLRTRSSVGRWLMRHDRVEAVELTDGTREEVDCVLLAVGIEPALDLARGLRLPLGSGGVLVDETLQAAPGIHCVGDIASHRHPLFQRPLRAEHWQVARRQGQALGSTVVGRPQPYSELPWFWSDQYDVRLEYVGHAAGFEQAVWRGEPAAGPYAVFYLKAGRVDAVLAVDDGRSIRFGRELIRGRQVVDPARLGDPTTDLRELVRAGP